MRFVGAPGFRQKRVFQKRAIFAETTANVVPNGRGSKTHFCTVGFEIGHLTSASNIVPKYFSLNWHFLSHSSRRRLGELFYFLAFSLFSSLSIFFTVAFSSATTSGICPFCSFSFLLFLLVVFVFFWLVSLLLLLLRPSFLSFDFYLLVFCLLLFRLLACSMFFPMSSDILSAGPPDAALICCRRTMDDIAPLLARNPTKTKKRNL